METQGEIVPERIEHGVGPAFWAALRESQQRQREQAVRQKLTPLESLGNRTKEELNQARQSGRLFLDHLYHTPAGNQRLIEQCELRIAETEQALHAAAWRWLARERKAIKRPTLGNIAAVGRTLINTSELRAYKEKLTEQVARLKAEFSKAS